MTAQTIRTALGLLQDDPDLESAWNDLQDAVTSPDTGIAGRELSKLLEAARRAHETRREWDAVARLLELEVALAAGQPDEAALQAELARVLEDDILDDAGATRAYKRLLELRQDDPAAVEALERNEAKRARWPELVERYMSEVEGTSDAAFRSSLLMSAAETAFRFGRAEATPQIIQRLEEALAVDPKNRRAALLLERIFRSEQRYDDAARVLEALATDGQAKDERLAAFVRLGRIAARKLKDPNRAAAAYERVLDMTPGHQEAMSYLAELFSERGEWDHLVSLYEDQLKSGGVRSGQETGVVFQIAMVHWRMRGKPEAAEPWFERLRKMEAAHQGMLNFFREWCEQRGDKQRLLNLLTDAQRSLPDGPERGKLAAEIALLAEGEANAGKAIEQYKAILRQEPGNVQARQALKRLYTQTEAWNALVELLRQELERTPAEDRDTRLAVLREIASVYRNHVRSDTALVTVLTQIVQLDDSDVEAIRDLVRVYEALSRWRDLLTYQQKLADLTADPDQKIALYRAVARRWLEQFSNVQNAVEAYEALLVADPSDEEARSKLRELYTKRRAWPQLFALCERELEGVSGDARMDLLLEMAKLAAERLDRGNDAIRLYKEALAAGGAAPALLDALEKQAEREKDFRTVAEVLERRVEAAPDDQSRLAVLQKLGGVYADRLSDPHGAASAWRRVLQLSPGHAKALRVLRDAYLASGDLEHLEELYASQNDWEGLAEVLSAAADKTNDPSQKVEFSLRTAKVFEERLRQPERAFRAYERILSVQPDDTRAARALVPIYEREERWARLPALYEILLGAAEDKDESVALYRRLSEVAGTKLGDKAAALSYARKAFDEAPGAEGALDFLESSSRAAGAWDSFVEAIQARLGKKKGVNATQRRALRGKLAEVLANEQGNIEEAVRVYRGLVEEDPTDSEMVGTLDRLLRASDRREDLRWLFELRVEAVTGEARAALLDEWAALEEEVFGEPARAIALYRRSLEMVSSGATPLSALPRLLLAAGDARGAAEVLEVRRDLSEGESRAERELDLAELYIEPLGEPEKSLDAAVRALEIMPREQRAIAVLERLQSLPSTRARAAEVLQTVYETTGDARREAKALATLLEATTDPGQRLGLFTRLADAYERKLSQASTALDVILRATSEHPAEIALWDRAADLASAAGRPTDLAEAMKTALFGKLPEEVEIELCERAATLHDEKLGDAEGAIPYLDKVLARHPTNERAFQRLRQILTASERWSQLETLYERVVDATEDESRQVELLAEVALVCEEITQQNTRAIHYYERILALDPVHEQALRALDTLYQAEKKPRELAALLERRLAAAGPEEGITFKLRLGKLYLEDLHEPPTALSHLEEVLRADVNDPNARQLVERILDVGSLRARAAELLETVYEARGEIRDLVRVLDIRLEAAANDDLRRDLLRRIAQLRDQRLQDDAGSLESLARLVPLDPADGTSRERLLEIGRRLGAQDRVATVLQAAAENADRREDRGDILMEVAKLYEVELNDRDRAEEVYRRVVELDREDPSLVLPAARALERIYASTGNHKALAETLHQEVRLENDPDARREIWARLGELYETVLSDAEGAVGAWRARLEEDPSDDRTLAALERLYERQSSWRQLVETLRAREQITKDSDARKRLLVKIAETLASPLGDVGESIQAWRAVLEEFGPERSTLAPLAALYEKSSEWHDLAQTLEQELALADESDARLALYARLGDVRREHLDELPGALDAYRQALTLDASHGPSRAALERLLEVEGARKEAAEILHPLYEADGDHERLLRVLEIEASSADLPSERLALLDKAVRVGEALLRDPGRAFGYATRAVREAAGEPSLRTWLERLETLTEVTGRHADLVAVLSDVAKDVLDEDVQLDVTLRVAELARKQLGDKELARTWYKRAIEIRETDRRALVALETLYEEMDDGSSLLEVLKKRVDAAENDSERRELLYREAKLTRDSLKDTQQAIAVFEQILELGLDAPAVEALEQLYEAAERYHDLVGLYERQIAESPRDKADLHVKLARVAEEHLKDVPRAFEELEAALAIEQNHAGAIEGLERLLAEGSDAEDRARAGEMLEPVYLRRAEWRKVMRTIDARLTASQDPDARRALLKRLAQLHEEQAEDYKAALETTARLLHEDLADESTWEELERLAKVASAEARLAAIYASELAEVSSDEPHTAKLARRTGELYASLGETDKALAFYRRALAFEPDSRPLFAAIDGLLVKAGRAAERVELYRQALDHRYEPADRLAALHTIADLEENALGTPEKAIETYRAALDADERDTRSLDALTRLYRAAHRHRDLADLYLRRIDVETEERAIAQHRLDLARLYRGDLADVGAAVDQLEAIVQALPTHRDAIAELEKLTNDDEHKARVVDILRPLYEREGDWRDLIRLNEQRLSLAQDDGERITIYRETAKLFEERAADLDRAFLATQMAFDLDPEDGETRADLDRLAERLSAWDALAESYERGIGEAEGEAKRELLSALARLHDEKRDDPRQALAAYERLHAVDETEVDPLDAIDRLAMMLSDWTTVVRALGKKADLVGSDDDRASLFRRIGEAKRDMLEDQPGAIQAYERALELDSSSVFTVDCLVDLYEQKDDAARLVELYRRRVELAESDEADLKYDLLLKIAQRYEEKLDNPREAIDALREALEVRAGDKKALEAQARLLRKEQMWPDLLDNLRLQASSAETTDIRVRLRRDIGDLYREKIDDPAEALEAYRAVLDEAPNDDAAVAAVREIGESREDLRLNAADILEPVLRGAGKFKELAGVLELRLRAQSDPQDRARTLRNIAMVEELNLSNPEGAEAALLRALSDVPDDAELHGEIERLAKASGGFGRYADTLAERAAAVLDPPVAKDLFTRLGVIAEDHLSDHPRAIQAYRSALDQAGDAPELLAALDRLYTKTGEDRELADVLERRVVADEDEGARADHLFRLASLQIKSFKDAAAGLSTLRRCLETKSDHTGAQAALEELTSERDLFDEAAEILEGVYRTQSDPAKLVALLEKRIGHAGAGRDRIRVRLELSRVVEEQAKDPRRAQTVLEEGLGDDPSDTDVLGEIERLAAINEGFATAAAALSKAIDADANLTPDGARDLWLRVAEWQKDKIHDMRAAEDAYEKALAKDAQSIEILRALEDLRRAPGREKELVETLRRRARLETDLGQKRELLREAKELAERAVSDVALAEAVLRQMLEENDGDRWAIDELTRIREAAGDHAEAVKLLLRSADLAESGDEAVKLKHRAASMRREELKDREGAITLYEELVEQSPEDEKATTALRALYEDAGRTKDLARLLERLIEVATAPAARTTLRVELAKLQMEKLDAANEAIDTLRSVLDEEQGHEGAVVVLSQLYEKTGKDDELAELLTAQIEIARERKDTSAELAFQVRLGEIYESRLANAKKAIETYEAVLERDPKHKAALQALARLHEGKGDVEQASKALERLLDLESGAGLVPLALRLADAHGQRKDDDAARKALERALAVDERNEDVRGRLRKLYEKGEDWEKLAALVAGDAEAGAAAPDKVRLYRQAADIHLQKRKDAAAAASFLEKASALAPDDREILLLLCDAYSSSGRGADAITALEKIIASYGGKRSKDLATIHHRVARAHLSSGNKDKALAELDSAFKIDPGSVQVLRDLGSLTLEMGDLDRAQKTFRALLLQKLDASSPITKGEVFYYLGEISHKQGDKPKAVQMLERALENDASLTKAKELLAELKK